MPLNKTTLSGSISVLGDIELTGSLLGTASWSRNSISASHALLADGLNAQDLTLANLTITNTASIQYLDVVYQSSSVIYSSGSNIFGDSPSDTQTLHGTVKIVDNAQVTGSLIVVGGITANLVGTASYANNANSASFASVANLAYNADNATSSSHALAADNAVSASYAANANSSSFASVANLAYNADNATSASYALDATNAVSASYSVNSDNAVSASYALDATNAVNAQTASLASALVDGTNITVGDLNISGILSFTNDVDAAAGGIPVNGVYRNGNFLLIRIS